MFSFRCIFFTQAQATQARVLFFPSPIIFMMFRQCPERSLLNIYDFIVIIYPHAK